MRFVLGALAIAGMIDAAAAQGTPPRQAPPPPAQQQRAAPGDLGMAIMSARVGSDGALQGGAGVASSSRLQAGVYGVTFGRSVAECVSTVTSQNNLGITYVIQVIESILYVYSWDDEVGYQDSSFMMLVYCHK